jgi:hypothetical protein
MLSQKGCKKTINQTENPYTKFKPLEKQLNHVTGWYEDFNGQVCANCVLERKTQVATVPVWNYGTRTHATIPLCKSCKESF